MPRGAPEGNQYAKKAEGERDAGLSLSFTCYLDAYELEFLQMSAAMEGHTPSNAAIRTKLRKLLKEAIRQEMGRVFQEYTRKKEQ